MGGRKDSGHYKSTSFYSSWLTREVYPQGVNYYAKKVTFGRPYAHTCVLCMGVDMVVANL
jgi:hypothetical protein